MTTKPAPAAERKVPTARKVESERKTATERKRARKAESKSGSKPAATPRRRKAAAKAAPVEEAAVRELAAATGPVPIEPAVEPAVEPAPAPPAPAVEPPVAHAADGAEERAAAPEAPDVAASAEAPPESAAVADAAVEDASDADDANGAAPDLGLEIAQDLPEDLSLDVDYPDVDLGAGDEDDVGYAPLEEEEEEDDTPLGESLPTDADGGLDPAIAAAARRLGIQRLYPEQERGIRDAIAGRDVLIVMPTGFGKSACYQVPSMVLPKPVVLISPLLALLKDQHEKLIKYQVPAVRVDGTVRGKARAQALERIAQGGSLLVMTTPETLASEEMHEALSKSGISLAAIDEAHCISEWGFDFRPAYLRLGEVLRGLGNPPMLALTATATEKVRTDIIRFLGMRSPTIVASSPHRSNLAFEVIECREAARLRALARLAQRLRRPGIIYCTTTREVDTVYTILAKLGIPVHRYHGKMSAAERGVQQEMYMKPGRRTVMVATSAFGLGIDKPDIRYVVHQQSPASLEQYVQEAGRAGRDGAKANCILLHDPADRLVHEALLSRSRLRPDQLYKLGSALAAWAAEGRTPTFSALALSADLGERPTNALLATLEEAGLVQIGEDLTVRPTVPADEIEEKARSLAGQFANMRTQDARRLDAVADYAQSNECRAVYLRRYFGEENGAPCGLCDVCRGRPERPTTFWSPVATPKRMNKKRRRGRGRGAQAQQQPRRRRGRGGKGRPGQPQQPGQPAQMGGAPGGQPQQGNQPRDSAQAQAIDPATGQPRRSGRRRRRRGRRGRRGRPNPVTPPTPPPASE